MFPLFFWSHLWKKIDHTDVLLAYLVRVHGSEEEGEERKIITRGGVIVICEHWTETSKYVTKSG